MVDAPKLKLEQLDEKDRKALEALLAKGGSSIAAITGTNTLANQEYRKKCIALRPEFERLAMEKGVTLAHIFTVSDKAPTVYRHPETGQEYTRGKIPAWLKIKDAKGKDIKNPAYLVK